jgi:hypothetical protein
MTGTPITLHIDPITLHIDPRPDGDPIAGRLRDSCGEEHRFAGLPGQLTLLEQARLKQAANSGDSAEEVSR